MKHLKLYESFTDDLELADFMERVYGLNDESINRYKEELNFVKEMRVSIEELIYFRENSTYRGDILKGEYGVKISAAKIAYTKAFERILRNIDPKDIPKKDTTIQISDNIDIDDGGDIFFIANFPPIDFSKYLDLDNDLKINKFEDIIKIILAFLQGIMYRDWFETNDPDVLKNSISKASKNIMKWYPDCINMLLDLDQVKKLGFDKGWVDKNMKADKYKGIIKF